MKDEYNLYIWGKGYTKPTQIKTKVLFAAAGQNHFVFVTSDNENYGFGSNKFGQLGLKQNVSFNNPVPIFQKHKIMSLHCGAQHTFFITDKYQVYSTGLNIKGQLGHSIFNNSNAAKLVVSLLPYGNKNAKYLNTGIMKGSKPPIIEVLEKFDLQVKIDDTTQKTPLLENEEYVIDIACGALFTIALTNKGRVFGCGYQGVNSISNHDQQIQKSKFKLIEISNTITKIRSSLSGSLAISEQGFIYVWGRFGSININVPCKIGKNSNQPFLQTEDEIYLDAQIGDEFVVLLNKKGLLFTFGQNIDDQLGLPSHQLPFAENPIKIDLQFGIEKIFVGRNYVLAVNSDSKQLYGWGSNRHGQIFSFLNVKAPTKTVGSQLKIEDNDKIIASSYFTLFLTKKSKINLTANQKHDKNDKSQQSVTMAQYNKLLQQYQKIKIINASLLQKCQNNRKQNQQTQTASKFEVSGGTYGRIFESNTIIGWKQIQLESQINEGGYGVIYKAKWRQIQVVVKKFKIQNGDVSLRDFQSECNAMQAVRHPNIVMFLGAVIEKPNYSIILEYCSRGSLWSYLQNKENNITWEDKRRFAIEIAQGVLYLHSCNPPILHRDLKSLNIFLDVNLRIKIGDFGWTKTLEEYMTNKIGTYQWMAPEVIGNKPYTEKADIFSYSIILWEIASRQPPYRNITGAKVSEEVLNKDLRPTPPSKCPESFTKLMKKCWDSDPNKRPSFKQIIRELQVMKLS